ncbi:ABC transporter permease [Actinoplanes sp. NPDC004185]
MADARTSRRTVWGAVLHKELLQSWRDRSVLILVFAVPLILAGITSVAFGRLAAGDPVTVGVVDHDGGTAAQTLVYQVLPGLAVGGGALVETRLYPGDEPARKATRDGDLAATIIIPSGFGVGLTAGRPPALRLLTGADNSLGAPVAEAVLRGFSAQTGGIMLAIATATDGPGGVTASQQVMLDASALRGPVGIGVEQAGTRTLEPAAYFAPSMLVLALFFCGQIVARGLVAERVRRTLARIAQSAVPMWQVLAAKYLVALGTGLLSAVVLLATFTAFGTSFGPVLPLATVVLVVATAMIAVSTLVVLIARTEQQAASLGLTVAFVLAVAGGNFIPPARTSPLLETVALATPNGWAARAFADLSVAGADPWAAVATPLAVLAGFTVVVAIVVGAQSRRLVRLAHA